MIGRRTDKQRGWSTVEFTLVGIPLIFMLVSTFEVARGMWSYHTLAYAVKEGTRYASVHGLTCATAPNNCTATIAQVAGVVQNAGAGLLPDQLTLTFTSINGATTCTLNNCLTNLNVWPTAPGNAAGSDISISAKYPFQSAIAMFWPGAGPGVMSTLGTYWFAASSRETMQY